MIANKEFDRARNASLKEINEIVRWKNGEDFIAILKYKAEGGRLGPTLSGYRPHIRFPFSDMLTTGRQIFIDKAIVHPGDTVRAYIKIISTNYFHKSLREGMEYEFSEGQRVIGTGRIITILNLDLKKDV